MPFKHYKLFETILDDVEIDEVEDVDIQDYTDYKYLDIHYYTLNDNIIKFIDSFLSKCYFIYDFKIETIIKQDEQKRTIIRFKPNNMTIDDFCKMIQYINEYTDLDSFINDNQDIFQYSLNLHKTEDLYDIYIYNEKEFFQFFKSFFPDATNNEIIKKFISSCFIFYNKTSNKRWFTLNLQKNKNFVDKNGNLLFEDFSSTRVIFDFSESYALIKENNEWKFIDEDGKPLESDKWYPDIYSFKNGYALVNNKVTKNVYPIKYNYIDTEGKLVFKNWYKELKPIQDGLIIATTKFGQKVINIKEKTIIPELENNYRYDSGFKNGYAIVKMKTSDGSELYNLISKTGEYISKDEWFESCEPFCDGYAVIQTKEGLYNYIDADGYFLFAKDRKKCKSFENGYAIVSDSKNPYMYNFIDTNGKEISKSPIFDVVENFIEGFAIIQNKNNKYNFIDTNGNLISVQWFDSCQKFKNGIAWILKRDKINFINKKNEELLPEDIVIGEKYTIKDNMVILNRLSVAYDIDKNFISLI